MIYQTIASECLGSPQGGIKGLIGWFSSYPFYNQSPFSFSGLAQHRKYYQPQTPPILDEAIGYRYHWYSSLAQLSVKEVNISSPACLWPTGLCAAPHWTLIELHGFPAVYQSSPLGSTRHPPHQYPTVDWCPCPRQTLSLINNQKHHVSMLTGKGN